MKRSLLALLVLSACSSNWTDNSPIGGIDTHTKKQVTEVVAKPPEVVKPVKYEITRKPNGGTGVFDFMFIVYVHEKIDHAQTDWLFNDVISKNRGVPKIAIDVWDSKEAFYQELKIYQKEDAIYERGGDLKAFAKERDKVTAKYDKHNIAQYTDNGKEVTKTYPEDRE